MDLVPPALPTKRKKNRNNQGIRKVAAVTFLILVLIAKTGVFPSFGAEFISGQRSLVSSQ